MFGVPLGYSFQNPKQVRTKVSIIVARPKVHAHVRRDLSSRRIVRPVTTMQNWPGGRNDWLELSIKRAPSGSVVQLKKSSSNFCSPWKHNSRGWTTACTSALPSFWVGIGSFGSQDQSHSFAQRILVHACLDGRSTLLKVGTKGTVWDLSLFQLTPPTISQNHGDSHSLIRQQVNEW